MVVRKIWTIHDSSDRKTHEDRLGQRTAAFACDQHVGAGRSFRERQYTVFLDDEHAAQWHHHQHAENSASDGENRDLRIGEVRRSERQKEDHGRNREHDTRGQRLTGGPNCLNDVVLQDRGAAQFLQH
jgi:hypothetical protein